MEYLNYMSSHGRYFSPMMLVCKPLYVTLRILLSYNSKPYHVMGGSEK